MLWDFLHILETCIITELAGGRDQESGTAQWGKGEKKILSVLLLSVGEKGAGVHTRAGGVLNLEHKERSYCWDMSWLPLMFEVVKAAMIWELLHGFWMNAKGQMVPLSSELRCNHICESYSGKSP